MTTFKGRVGSRSDGLALDLRWDGDQLIGKLGFALLGDSLKLTADRRTGHLLGSVTRFPLGLGGSRLRLSGQLERERLRLNVLNGPLEGTFTAELQRGLLHGELRSVTGLSGVTNLHTLTATVQNGHLEGQWVSPLGDSTSVEGRSEGGLPLLVCSAALTCAYACLTENRDRAADSDSDRDGDWFEGSDGGGDGGGGE